MRVDFIRWSGRYPRSVCVKLRVLPLLCLVAVAVLAVTCGSKATTPTTPSAPTTPVAPAPPSTAPLALVSPVADDQLSTLRPTLTVTTPTAVLAGRTYEFQIADRSDFIVGAGTKSAYYSVNVTKTGVSESAATTAYAIEQDLQPATRFYWRARWTTGAVTADWSDTKTFRTQIIGYSQPGELYDPMVNGATVADARAGRTTFIAGKGLRVDDSDSYVRYGLKQTVTNGEFSLDVEGISDSPVSENPDTAKLKILSMCDRTTDINFSDYLMNVQYRGFNGNPPNAISFKMLLGEDDDAHKLEPDLATRTAGVRHLSSGNTYYWRAVWGGGFHLTVVDGGVGGVGGGGSGNGGTIVYDYGQSSIYTYAPPSHYAYLGTNNSGSETGSWPKAIYRNVWIANKARPSTLGSAMTPLK
jgi:hypothetical protein